MPTAKLYDEAKCHKRNRLAALKYGVDAIPVRILKHASVAPRKGARGRGGLPENDQEAIAIINQGLSENGDALTLQDVYIHYMEAGNSNFISDRYCFIAPSTLENVSRAAEAGIAFMNSHRTGDVSTPSELPFGRTFAARYERFKQPDGTMHHRTLLGVYLLRGTRPNGDNGPSTDDLSKGISGGTIFDVSMGLIPGDYGEALCDVCLHPVNGYDCEHIPGTTRAMDEDQIAAQEARGVPGGAASYTLHDFTANEVSAVYDGAVPGAGFAKARRLARQGKLTRTVLSQAAAAYHTAARSDDFSPVGTDKGGSMVRTDSNLRTAVREVLSALVDDVDLPERPERPARADRDRKPATPKPQTGSPALRQLQTRVDRLQQKWDEDGLGERTAQERAPAAASAPATTMTPARRAELLRHTEGGRQALQQNPERTLTLAQAPVIDGPELDATGRIKLTQADYDPRQSYSPETLREFERQGINTGVSAARRKELLEQCETGRRVLREQATAGA